MLSPKIIVKPNEEDGSVGISIMDKTKFTYLIQSGKAKNQEYLNYRGHYGGHFLVINWKIIQKNYFFNRSISINHGVIKDYEILAGIPIDI